MSKIGLVLSGGGAKGAYEAGVITALYELDIVDKIKVVSGTSIGALNLTVFPAQEKLLCENIWKNIKRDASNLLTADGLRKTITDNVDFSKIKDFNMDLYACAYNLSRMAPEYFHLNNLTTEDFTKAILASTALPPIFPPVEINGTMYTDGGCNDHLHPQENCDITPILPLKNYDLDLAIVVYLSKHQRSKCSLPNTKVVNIIPSQPLGTTPGTGSMDFSKTAINNRIILGYQDTMNILSTK